MYENTAGCAAAAAVRRGAGIIRDGCISLSLSVRLFLISAVSSTVNLVANALIIVAVTTLAAAMDAFPVVVVVVLVLLHGVVADGCCASATAEEEEGAGGRLKWWWRGRRL